jgi:hypothetical protein
MFYLYTIALLNFLDLCLTSLALGFQITSEQNPLMRILWEAHPVYFVFVKLSLSILLIWIAHRLPKETFRKWRLLYASTIVLYTSVLGLHLVWVSSVI